MFHQKQVKSDCLPDPIKKMLTEHLNMKIDFEPDLSISQKKAFDLFKNGSNLLILGQAGYGKSFLIKIFQENIKNKKTIYLCATTGISAYNIGGMTIHSFMGIGTGDNNVEYLIRQIYRKKTIRERLISTDVLIIDEISMLSAELFEKINIICQHIRRNKSFFGGIQVIFSGDLLQLLPVFNKNPKIFKTIDERLIIESNIFNIYFNTKNIIILNENFRQKNDANFSNLLGRIRIGSFTDDDISILKDRINKKPPPGTLQLVSSNKKAQIINDYNISNINNEPHIFYASFSTKNSNHEMIKILTDELQLQFKQKGIEKTTLKKGCRVMLIKNISTELGLINGSIGTVIDFINNEPKVKFDNGQITIIPYAEWELNDPESNICAVAKQIPLILAYSITIHRSQSLTLDSAILDLEDCFTDHMVYVALSRLRSLNGTFILSLNKDKITINQKMKYFLEKLKN